ncbi:serine hydrolase domain-containing protein [Amantichitinum ursilacus]|uniref:6-aminohexanoate-dimer hydrolase n=1 Tax=Amantichitinum ursilacus TaxID=857265 RepID=A0A0N0GL59_9NEIS|nr:serine hydrolase [Amantichitinum ursilacus]KPC49626.1 6-aminohexanoate-dimer hydrolase [Amantichitinum ursilacus]
MKPTYVALSLLAMFALNPAAWSAPQATAAAASATATAIEGALPDRTRLLFWTPAEQRVGYQHMEAIFPGRSVDAAATPSTLRVASKPLDVAITWQGKTTDIAGYMQQQNMAGVLVLSHGQIVLEKYALGLTQSGRWTSWSMAKSVTSTLVGAAVKDGAIHSVDDAVTTYLPELAGSGYRDVTVRQLLTMTSGVRWNEDYRDPAADVNKLGAAVMQKGDAGLLDYMARLPREAEPGTAFVYKTGESDLIGLLVSRATHQPLADYLSQKVWQPVGMEQPAFWVNGPHGTAMSGCCLSSSLRDYGRFGQFFMHGGKAANGAQILPQDWTREATTSVADTANTDHGYGYQWWTGPNGTYTARGIFGQAIYLDPAKDLVIVQVGAWPHATDAALVAQRDAMFAAVAAQVH